MSKKAERARRRKDYLRRIVAVVKDTPCSDCAKRLKTQQMTFDHLPEFKKRGDINDFIRAKSRRGLLREMAKCDVVCRPCHNIREMRRGRMGLTIPKDVVMEVIPEHTNKCEYCSGQGAIVKFVEGCKIYRECKECLGAGLNYE